LGAQVLGAGAAATSAPLRRRLARIPFTRRLYPKLSPAQSIQNGIWYAAMRQHRDDYQE
jgi:hypothetical protein